MALAPKAFTGKKQLRLANFHRMPLVYMICTAMCGNGVPIIGMTIIKAHPLTGVSGREVMRVPECCVAVRGTTTQAMPVPLTVAGSTTPTAAAMSVFVWPRGLFNLLYFFPFFPFYSFLLFCPPQAGDFFADFNLSFV